MYQRIHVGDKFPASQRKMRFSGLHGETQIPAEGFLSSVVEFIHHFYV